MNRCLTTPARTVDYRLRGATGEGLEVVLGIESERRGEHEKKPDQQIAGGHYEGPQRAAAREAGPHGPLRAVAGRARRRHERRRSETPGCRRGGRLTKGFSRTNSDERR